jgi:hypothetical protein
MFPFGLALIRPGLPRCCPNYPALNRESVFLLAILLLILPFQKQVGHFDARLLSNFKTA